MPYDGRRLVLNADVVFREEIQVGVDEGHGQDALLQVAAAVGTDVAIEEGHVAAFVVLGLEEVVMICADIGGIAGAFLLVGIIAP